MNVSIIDQTIHTRRNVDRKSMWELFKISGDLSETENSIWPFSFSHDWIGKMEEQIKKGEKEEWGKRKREGRKRKEGKKEGKKEKEKNIWWKGRGEERKITTQCQSGYFKMKCPTMLRAVESDTRCLGQNLAAHTVYFIRINSSRN